MRQRLMLTQGELGERAGISMYTVNAAEGGRNVSPKTGRALARALGVEPEDLLEEADYPKAEAPPPSEGDERWRPVPPDLMALVESLDEGQLSNLREWLTGERIRLGIVAHDNPHNTAIQSEFRRAVRQLMYANLEQGVRVQEREDAKSTEASRRNDA
jgi:transcriptional regulator with XRE-family HTH domain